MKTKNFILSAIAALMMFGVYSCSEEATNDAPEFASVELSSDNKTATLTFSEGVFTDAEATGALTNDDLMVTIEGVDFTYEVTHTAGASTTTIDLMITSITEGTEIVKVKPASADAIFDAEGKAMEATAEITSESLAKDLGIIGEWYSSGDNVAALLVTYFQVDSIYAKFNTDNTYLVEQFNIGNETTTPDLEFTGSFTIEKSDVDEIWTIVLSQELPFAAEASGIFEIRDEVLWYEVVQVTGTQNIPPTPADGFGSSNGGTLGDTNIQKFIRIAK